MIESLALQREKSKAAMRERESREQRKRVAEERKEGEAAQRQVESFVSAEESIHSHPASTSTALSPSTTSAASSSALLLGYEAVQTSKGIAYVVSSTPSLCPLRSNERRPLSVKALTSSSRSLRILSRSLRVVCLLP